MKYIYLLCALLIATIAKAQTSTDTLQLADPTILLDKGQYYLYGTSSEQGFYVYQSADLVHWRGPVGKCPGGFALHKGDSFGTRAFWAPQVFKFNNKFYMAYAAEERLAIAESDSPLGPFKQRVLHRFSGMDKQIDPYFFKDTDGKLYLFYVREHKGNRVYVARINNDLSDIDTATTKECVNASLPWENEAHHDWPVSEGPTVIKHKGLYYLLYSANDFQNIHYSVGYATATSPFGPWTKTSDSPFISREKLGPNGTGHGDIFTGKDGQMYYVLHTHHSPTQIHVRKTALVKIKFTNDKPARLEADKASFRYLMIDK